jgi:short-subunit dehydrogenase
VRGFGVDVVVIEPGLIKTSFGDVAAGSVSAAPAEGPYGDFTAAVAKATREAYEGGLPAKLGGGPDTVARKIEKAISKRRPRPRYSVTPSAKLALFQRRLMSDRMWDGVLRTQFPQPGRS